MTPGLLARHTIRETRGAAWRLAFFIACLAIGVGAVTTIAGLSASFESGIRAEAKELLGADLVVQAWQPLPPEVDAALARLEGAEVVQTREQPQMIQTGEGKGLRTLLAELKVVERPYPFYGDLQLMPRRPLNELLTEEAIVVASGIAAELQVRTGDRIRIGGQPFEIAGVAHEEPDRITGFMYIGPRVYLSPEGFARTGLADVGTRIRHKAMVKLPPMPQDDLETIKVELETALESAQFVRIETFLDGKPSLQRGLEQLERFLGLVALLSLLLGGLGVSQAVRAWIAGRLDSIAVLKCVGMRPREILALYTMQAALLGLAGSVCGALLGAAVMVLLPSIFSEYVPTNLIDPWQPMAIFKGVGLGVIVALVFSLPPLFSVLRVSPVRVFRRDAEPLPGARWIPFVTGGIVVLGIGAMAAWQARSALVGAIFTGGVLTTALLLAAAAWLVKWLITRLPRDWSQRVWLRHGLAALARPGANTIPSIVALGLGLLVLFSGALLGRQVGAQLSTALPENLPSAVMINVRGEQEDGLRALLAEEGADNVNMVPVVIGRVTAVKGTPVEEYTAQLESDNRQRRFQQEQWLTYAEELGEGDEITRGALWSDPDAAELSLEEDFARRRGLELGDTIALSFGVNEIEFSITSLRRIRWEELGVNFEMLAEPGYLDNVFQMRIATLNVPNGEEHRVQDRVVAAFPNVTFVPVSDVLSRIAVQLDRIAWGVRFLGLFIIGAAVAVLAGTVGIEAQRRGREVALLKTIGMTRREVASVFAAEYALIGIIAGIIGIGGGAVIAGLMITRGLEMEFSFSPAGFAGALVAGIAIAVTAGIAASTGALRKRPVEVLRYQE